MTHVCSVRNRVDVERGLLWLYRPEALKAQVQWASQQYSVKPLPFEWGNPQRVPLLQRPLPISALVGLPPRARPSLWRLWSAGTKWANTGDTFGELATARERVKRSMV